MATENSLLPRIGLTSRMDRTGSEASVVLRTGYVRAITMAGGIPWVLPVQPEGVFPELLEHLDGLVLTGGEDVNPLLFGQQPHLLLGRVDTARDLFELALAREWLQTGKPLLAICRGIQLLQIAAGGAILQDIHACMPAAYRHEQRGLRGDPAHTVDISKGSTLSALLETSGSIEVNSIHHQAVDEPASGFRVCAQSPDGVVEGIEAGDGRLVVGVQWHPEEMDAPVQQRLFRNFIRAIPRPAEAIPAMAG